MERGRTCVLACTIALTAATGAQAQTLHPNRQLGRQPTSHAAPAGASIPVSRGPLGLQVSAAGDYYANVGSNQAIASPARQSSNITTVVDDAGTSAAWSGSERTGAEAYDTATVTGVAGGPTLTGEVGYSLFANGSCTGTAITQTVVSLNSDGSVPDSGTSGELDPGGYSFQAGYLGDSNYAPSIGRCEPFRVARAAATTWVYWADAILFGMGTDTIGQGTLQGTNVAQTLNGGSDPIGVAVSGQRLYWGDYQANGSGTYTIWAQRLFEGQPIGQPVSLLQSTGPVNGVAVEGQNIFWADYYGSMGTATLNSTGLAVVAGTVNQSLISDPNGVGTADIAVNSTHIYWANYFANKIGEAKLDGSDVVGQLISTQPLPWGVAVNNQHVYWTISAFPGTIGDANLDGTDVNQNLITGLNYPNGIAVTATNIYWADGSTIAEANLDGTNVNQNFITGTNVPYGVAVSQS